MYVFSSKTGQEFGSPIFWGASIAVVTRKTLDRYSTDTRPNNNRCHDQYSVDIATDTYIYRQYTDTSSTPCRICRSIHRSIDLQIHWSADGVSLNSPPYRRNIGCSYRVLRSICRSLLQIRYRSSAARLMTDISIACRSRVDRIALIRRWRIGSILAGWIFTDWRWILCISGLAVDSRSTIDWVDAGLTVYWTGSWPIDEQ